MLGQKAEPGKMDAVFYTTARLLLLLYHSFGKMGVNDLECAVTDFEIFSAAFTVDPITGVLRNKTTRRKAIKGSIAGCLDPNGYLVVKFQYKRYYVHRIIWLLLTGDWPAAQIDHINGIRNDNHPENLRDVSRQMNLKNNRTLWKLPLPLIEVDLTGANK